MKSSNHVNLEILNITSNSEFSEIEFKISKKSNDLFETLIGLVNAETFLEARVLSEVSNFEIEKSNQAYVRLEDSQILSAKTTVKILSSIDDEKYDSVSSQISSMLLDSLKSDVLKIEVDVNE